MFCTIYSHLSQTGVDIRKFVKIGRPGYRVTKQRDPENGQQSLLFEVGSQDEIMTEEEKETKSI